jgi:ribosomal protein L37E
MTVAYPTTGMLTPHREAPALACTSCGTRAVALDKPFCAHCGSRVSLSVKSGIASIAATRSRQLTALAVLNNILVGGATFGVVYLLSDAARLTEAAVGLEAVRFIIVGTLLAVAIRYGVRGLRQTRDGVLRRRAWAIVGLVVSGLYSLLILGSITATAALYLFVL